MAGVSICKCFFLLLLVIFGFRILPRDLTLLLCPIIIPFVIYLEYLVQ